MRFGAIRRLLRRRRPWWQAAGDMSARVRPLRRRDAGAADALPESLSPLLRRIYAARHVTSEAQLATALSALLPVGRWRVRSRPRGCCCSTCVGRVLIVGDFDADGATSTALMMRALRDWGFQPGGFPGARSLPLRLRTDAWHRRARGADSAHADRHRGQRHFQHRGRRAPRARMGSTCWSPITTCPAPSCRMPMSS